MTRAEERAFEAYPDDNKAVQRYHFRKGYRKAEKDTIRRIREEIEKRINSIVSCPFIEAEFGAYERREGKMQSYRELLPFLDELEIE